MNQSNKSNTLIITGHTPLKGSVSVQGSKNATLPILSVLPLLPEAEIYNVPNLSDIEQMKNILEYLGATCSYKQGVFRFSFDNLTNKKIDESFSNKMRASSLFLGPLLAKFGEVSVGMPGGCVIGSRPLDIHLDGLETLGAEIELDHGYITAKGKNISGEYTLPFPSVGATQNLIAASVFSNSTVTLHNIAIEPEVTELIHFLNKAGAKIKLIDSKTVIVKGVKKLKKTTFTIQPDRIEAFTLLTAAIASKGQIKLNDFNPEILSAPIQVLAKAGAEVKVGKRHISAKYTKSLRGQKVVTGVYPGFPTDCQQLVSTLLLGAETPSVITENVFNNRFKHLDELRRLGADVKIENNVAIVNHSELIGGTVNSYDLRGAASMIVAGLMAEDITIAHQMKYLYRGYENLIEKLNHLGAKITYKKDDKN